MLERNKDFAAQQSAAATLMPSLPRAMPNVKAVIIGCADMRVDPAHIFGIKPGDPAMLAHYFQIQEGELKAKAVPDARAAVAVDVAALRAIPSLPSQWFVSGLVYDVATGLVEIIVPPAPIRSA